MDKWTQKKKIIKEIFGFLLKFNLLLIPFYAVIYFDVDFYLLQELFARFIGSILRLLSYPVIVSDFFIYVEGLSIDISRDCLGWKSFYSLFALVLASPGKLKDKLRFLGVWMGIYRTPVLFRPVTDLITGLREG